MRPHSLLEGAVVQYGLPAPNPQQWAEAHFLKTQANVVDGNVGVALCELSREPFVAKFGTNLRNFKGN